MHHLIKTILISLSFNCCIVVDANAQPDNTAKEPINITAELPDEIIVSSKGEKNENNSFMPWIIALGIGMLSILANVIVAYQLKKSNKENISAQLDNAKDIALAEFKANLATQNRQDWIDGVRGDLSQLISFSAWLAMHEVEDKALTLEVHGDQIQKLKYFQAKVNLLLNPIKAEQKRVIDGVNSLVLASLSSNSETEESEFLKFEGELVASSRALFEIHWEKIKNSFSE
jgi:hypothetical protein